VKESPAEFATSLLPGSEANVEKGGNLAAHEDPTSVDSVPVPEEHWNQLPLQKKIVLLLPDEDSTWSDSVAEFPSDWQKRVEEAVSRTLKQTRKIWDDQMSKKLARMKWLARMKLRGNMILIANRTTYRT
jgi:hypothetical protein